MMKKFLAAGSTLLIVLLFIVLKSPVEVHLMKHQELEQVEGTYLRRCQKVEQAEMDKERVYYETHLRYVLGEAGRAIVHFQFNLNIENNDETLFGIFSNRIRKLVYLGPYKDSLSLEIDANLTTDKGYDNLEFRLLQFEQKRFCSWANESDYPYWHPNAKISIDFLPKGIFDEEGLFKQFEVTIR
ncbi:MAG: hypothetical protein SVR94_12745 [Pseudomonadota bacterium]|nr:hypothetical protein [Pseudomonadota bacterium]